MSEAVTVRIDGVVATVTIDNPPVNAFSHHVRVALQQSLATLDEDAGVQAIVLACAGKSFSAGADMRELGGPPLAPSMGDVMRGLDSMRAILVAAIHGQALGGGLELALICDYRVATADVRLALPEIKLGLIPGGGGTQRLPRLIGIGPAIDLIVAGNSVGAQEALAIGLIDAIAEDDIVAEAEALARRYSAAVGAHRRLSSTATDGTGFDFAERRRKAVASTRLEAAGMAVDAVEAATRGPFDDGLEREASLFHACRQSIESAALRYLFASERSVAHGAKAGVPRTIASSAVIGAGTMGAGVAVSLLDAGLPVTLVETAQAALDRGVGSITRIYDSLVDRGRLAPASRDERLGRLSATTELTDVSHADLVIECVFEDMAVKQRLFERLGAIVRPGAVLATNTSALDVNAIAAASGRGDDVVGMHFFSPANIMRLVEVINAEQTVPDTLATAMAMTKRMNKIGVVSGVCDGFIGNRMIGGYLRQAGLLLLEGGSPDQIDRALRGFGMAMGPHQMGDMAGLDIQAAARVRRRAEGKLPADDPFGAVGDRLVAMGRTGMKSGLGMYRYESGSRTPIADPVVDAIIKAESAAHGIVRRSFDDAEIVARCILPLINEGARIIQEGIALGAADVDVVYCNGYGFPRPRGGPMFYADTLGADVVLAQIEQFRDTLDARLWQPSPLLIKVAASGGKFTDLPRR